MVLVCRPPSSKKTLKPPFFGQIIGFTVGVKAAVVVCLHVVVLVEIKASMDCWMMNKKIMEAKMKQITDIASLQL